MARINTISDGQPFTYQLLNQIIQSINDIKEPEEGNEELIEIRGPETGNSKNKPLIIFGSDTLTIPENRTSDDGTIGFRVGQGSGNGAGFNSNPIVLATLVDPAAGGGIPIGYLIITKITNNNFSYRVKLLRKRNNSTKVEINYVAFGTTSK
jgi:hypothetical protein